MGGVLRFKAPDLALDGIRPRSRRAARISDDDESDGKRTGLITGHASCGVAVNALIGKTFTVAWTGHLIGQEFGLRDDAVSLTLLPSESAPSFSALLDKSFQLSGAANRLGGSLHPLVRRAAGDLVRSMNCYYSNLIEGHDTLPRDIDRALKSEFVADPVRRNLQVEARAHIEVQAMVDHGDLDPLGTGQELVRTLHREFCMRLPDDLLWAGNPDTGERIGVTPGNGGSGTLRSATTPLSQRLCAVVHGPFRLRI